MTHILSSEDKEYINWLFSPESYSNDFLENTENRYKAKLIKIPDTRGSKEIGLKFESYSHLILFKLKYS